MKHWPRVTKKEPCPICGKPDWCGIAPDGSACICMRTADGAKKEVRNGGYLHILRDDLKQRERSAVRRVRVGLSEEEPADLGPLAAEYAGAVDFVELEDFADKLGLCLTNLIRLRIGWAEQYRAWSFPMQDSEIKRVCGIRLRTWTGNKFAVQGGREGLFIPVGLDCSGLVLVCEGPTDTAAALDLGFEALGRASCRTGTRMLAKLAKGRQVVIVGDNDTNGAGRKGAESLACVLVGYCRSVRVIYPSEGIKDLRAWKVSGLKREELQAVIDAAEVRRLTIEIKEHGHGSRRR